MGTMVYLTDEQLKRYALFRSGIACMLIDFSKQFNDLTTMEEMDQWYQDMEDAIANLFTYTSHEAETEELDALLNRAGFEQTRDDKGGLKIHTRAVLQH